MFTGDVVIQTHESFSIDKSALGKPNNPHFNSGAREIALNLAIRGNKREDGNGYITVNRTNKNDFKKLPKRNIKIPNSEPTMTVEELVMTMNNFIYTDALGDLFYPEVYFFNPFIKLAESDINNTIPEGLPVRAYIDEEGVEQVHTWLSWRKNNSTMVLYEGYYYMMSCYGNAIQGSAHKELTGEELMLIYNDTNSDITLVDEIPVVTEE